MLINIWIIHADSHCRYVWYSRRQSHLPISAVVSTILLFAILRLSARALKIMPLNPLSLLNCNSPSNLNPPALRIYSSRVNVFLPSKLSITIKRPFTGAGCICVWCGICVYQSSDGDVFDIKHRPALCSVSPLAHKTYYCTSAVELERSYFRNCYHENCTDTHVKSSWLHLPPYQIVLSSILHSFEHQCNSCTELNSLPMAWQRQEQPSLPHCLQTVHDAVCYVTKYPALLPRDLREDILLEVLECWDTQHGTLRSCKIDFASVRMPSNLSISWFLQKILPVISQVGQQIVHLI